MTSIAVVGSFASCRAPARVPERAPMRVPLDAPVNEPVPVPVDASTGTAERPVDTAAVDTTAATPTDISADLSAESPAELSAEIPTDETAPKTSIHGSLSTRYRGRFTSGEQDHDVYEVVELVVGDAERDRWTGALLAESAYDLDGQADPQATFHSLSDTYDSRLTARLYEAYVENHSSKDLSVLRFGRQIEYQTPETVTFDGVQVHSRELGPQHVTLGVYGGVPARIYTSSDPGNIVYGTFVEARPWAGARARLDWMHLEDDTLLGEHNNDLYAVELGQAFGQRWKIDGTYSRLEGRDRDVSARTMYTDADADFDVQLAWFQLLETQNDLAIEFDPFTDVLLEQFPYRQARVLASKGVSEKVRVQGGFDVRRVSDENDIGTFNRDFERGFATTTLSDVLPARVALSLTGEVWDSGADDIQTWGADLSRELGTKTRVSLGSYYSLYKTDILNEEERDDVRTYYLRVRTRNTTGWSWDVRYEFEDSLDDYSTLRLGATWRF